MKSSANSDAPAVLLWSGGKDALLALLALEEEEEAGRAVAPLVTTVAGPAEEVTMHGVGLPLVRAQARALSLPLRVMRQPEGAPNEVYERLLEETLAPLRAQGVRRVAAGDLFLGDVRAYRSGVLRRIGVEPLFPLWRREAQRDAQRDTGALARQFIEAGHRAVVCSVDTAQLDAAFAGRDYDAAFLKDLPEGVGPCGERGAFHTFVCGGPRFREAVPVAVEGVQAEGRMAQVRLRLAR